jgi:hypothetical protein
MSKRPLKEVEGMYLYTPQTNATVTCQLSKNTLTGCAGRRDRTRRSKAMVENENDIAE